MSDGLYLVCTKLENDIDVLIVLEVMQKLYDVII